MFIVRFKGGLGNQIFQYTFLRSLELTFPNEIVVADIHDYDLAKFHYGFELSNVFKKTRVRFGDLSDIIRLSGRHIFPYGKIFSKIYGKSCRILGRKNKYIFIESRSNFAVSEQQIREKEYDFSLLEKDRDYYFDGQWQNSNIYRKFSNVIFEELSFSDKDYKELESIINEMNESNSVAVHVRRGDYLGTVFDIISADYYERAFEVIDRMVDNPVYYFFSEDEKYISTQFKMKNKRVISCNTGDKSYRDMLLMSSCKHNIIANSSFSYWGAELNKNTDKIVIRPNVDKPAIVYPKEWIAI